MGLFSRRDPDASEARIARLETHLNNLQTYLEDAAKSAEEPALAAPGADQSPDARHPASPPRIVDADMVEQTLAQLSEQIAALATGVTEMESRLSSISTEITNQLGELGHEIDTLASRLAADSGLSGEQILADLKAAQTRLAQEQARYQIAFRQDLADLAERIKPPL
jgi:small-conductance mechanosensitive channel